MDPVTIKIKSIIHHTPNPPMVIMNRMADAYRLKKNLCAPSGQDKTINSKKVGKILFSEILNISFIPTTSQA
tara:strand:+ start:349 stop:564 length:216 start_codon:yes stop_codon:yes gene_type:complete